MGYRIINLSTAIVVFLLTLIPAHAVVLNDADIIVGDSRAPFDEVSVLDPDTGAKTLICQCTRVTSIYDLAVFGRETIYAIGQIDGTANEGIVEIDPATGDERLVKDGFSFLQGVAVEEDGTILVTRGQAFTIAEIIRVDPSTGQQVLLASGGLMNFPEGIAVGPNGDIFIATGIDVPPEVRPEGPVNAAGVMRIDPVSGDQTIVAFGDEFDLPPIERMELISATDLAVDTDGIIYVLDKRFRGSNLRDETRLIRVDPLTGAQTMLFKRAIGVDREESGFDFMGIDVFNGVLFFVDYRLSETGQEGVSRFDPAVGFREGVSSENFVSPTGIAVVQGTGGGVRGVLLGLGSFSANGGWVEVIEPTVPHANISWLRLPWTAYTAADGQARPASCDVDGDGRAEVVMGLGPFASNGGWLEVRDDRATGYAHLAWVRVRWSAYNSANGETFPACGDLDGDGRDELAIGLGSFPNKGGWVEIVDDATTGYAHLAWVRVGWRDYNIANGAVHPAIGNLDADAAEELVLGLGTYTPDGGWVEVKDDAGTGYTPMAWFRVPWTAYNNANGETRPAICNLNGDDRRQIVLGLGSYPSSGGWLHFRTDAAQNFVPLDGTPTANGWARVPWPDYNTVNGETFPACGDLDGDGRDELAIGLGSFPSNGGWLAIKDDLTMALDHSSWARVHWAQYTSTNGLTRPAIEDVEAPVARNELTLDGDDDFARTNPGMVSPSPLDIDTFTVEAWVFPTQDKRMAIVSDSAYFLDVWFQSGAANGGLGIRFAVFNRAGTRFDTTVFRDITRDQWNHVAVMFDGSTRECWLAINGNVSAHPNCLTGELDTEFDTFFGVGTPFSGNIAGDAPATLAMYVGRLDEIRISNVIRYTANFSPEQAPTADGNTVGLWHFDEAPGSTSFADSSGNGHALTGLNGASTVAGSR